MDDANDRMNAIADEGFRYSETVAVTSWNRLKPASIALSWFL
jgi:hypothetical protein